MYKNIIILISVIFFSACGGGSDGGSSINNDRSVNSFLPIDYTNPNIYPISNTAVFSLHSTADMFTLSDGSAWQITGTSSSSYNTGFITSNVTIFKSTISTPDPVLGDRSEYYLVGDGINPAFFVNPLLITYSVNDNVYFSLHSTGDIFTLSDGAAYQITGTSNRSYNAGSTISNVFIYPSTTSIPDPVSGSRSDYYLIGDDINPAFFIKPLLMTPVIIGNVVFNYHTTGSVFTLSDGTVWQITGTSNRSYNTGSIISNVFIYPSTTSIPDPVSGSRSDYYLIGEGINPAFFIKRI